MTHLERAKKIMPGDGRNDANRSNLLHMLKKMEAAPALEAASIKQKKRRLN